jgi:hypothetical protein
MGDGNGNKVAGNKEGNDKVSMAMAMATRMAGN